MSTASTEGMPEPEVELFVVPEQWGNPSRNGRPKRHVATPRGTAVCRQAFDGDLVGADEARRRTDGVCKNCLRELGLTEGA